MGSDFEHFLELIDTGAQRIAISSALHSNNTKMSAPNGPFNSSKGSRQLPAHRRFRQDSADLRGYIRLVIIDDGRKHK